MNYLITSDFLVEFRSNILYGVDYLRLTCVFLSIGVFHSTSGFLGFGSGVTSESGFWVLIDIILSPTCYGGVIW